MKGFSLLEANVALFLLAVFFLNSFKGMLKLHNLAGQQGKNLSLTSVYLNYLVTDRCSVNYTCVRQNHVVVICSLLSNECQNF